MNEPVYTLKTLAAKLGCQPHRISYLFLTRKIAEPRWIGGRRVYTAKDVARIAKVLKMEVPHEEDDHEE